MIMKEIENMAKDLAYLEYLKNKFPQKWTKKDELRLIIFKNIFNRKLRLLGSSLGRMAKKGKLQRKYFKVLTLTECFGIPWKIIVRKNISLPQRRAPYDHEKY